MHTPGLPVRLVWFGSHPSSFLFFFFFFGGGQGQHESTGSLIETNMRVGTAAAGETLRGKGWATARPRRPRLGEESSARQRRDMTRSTQLDNWHGHRGRPIQKLKITHLLRSLYI